MLVLAKKYGQLGNRLILFSHLIACAREHNLKLVNIAFDDYAHLFESTCDVAWPHYPPTDTTQNVWRWLKLTLYQAVRYMTDIAVMLHCTEVPVKIIRLRGEEFLDIADEEFLKAARTRRWVLLLGWCFRDYSAVKRHADVIRDYFQPIVEHRENVAKVIADARVDCDVLVGVHIRHGDYAKFLDGKYFYSLSQYVHGMHAMVRLLGPQRVRFLVCSNVPQDKTQFGDLKITMGTDHLIEDMYAFAQCDYLMGPPSTYTMWASFFGEVPLYAIKDSEYVIELKDFSICEAF